MKMRPGLGKLRVLMLALPLVPAFFVVQHVGPEGFAEAEGCIGGGGGVARQLPLVSVVATVSNGVLPVATDGFVPLSLTGVATDDPLANLEVEVTNAAAEVVPGSLKLLEPIDGFPWVGWQADAPLEVGSKLSFKAKPKAYPPSVEILLDVVGPPTELSAATLAFGDWLNFGHGVGEMVTCTSAPNPCNNSSPPLSLPGNEEILQAVHATWTPPQVNGNVAWEAHLLLAGGAQPVQVPAPSWLFQTASNALNLGPLVFPKGTSEYCGELVVRDLRTGDERRSKLCAAPQMPSGETARDYPLSYCSAPPTPALKRAWCETNSKSPLCADADPTPPEPNPEHPVDPNSAADDGAHAPRTSSGCQMASGVPASSGYGLLLALGGLAAAWQRNRSRRR